MNGPYGQVGDDIVQPGQHDDNRVSENSIGKLIRSHLGVAGDCAVATVDKRRLSPEILDIGTAVKRLGEPELDDKVIKSGRTTAVTRGVVRRIHVVTKINYDEAGDQNIGCFEIGPDPDHSALDNEISMGGDSGSAWLLVQRNKPSDMMLGLHFAGEVGNEPEHALACYAGSVFEKLGISPSVPEDAMQKVGDRGYASLFIGVKVPAPSAATEEIANDLLEVKGSTVLAYTHFSLAMSRSRRFARWVAWNIDGGSLKRLNRSNIAFRKDKKLPDGAQIGNELYTNNSLDRGHIARRADLVWGALPEAQNANTDSFYFTNITPQHENFNQSAAGGIWGKLEDAVFADVDVADLKISVIGGPLFSDTDPLYRGVQLPKRFWKIIYYREAGNDTVMAKGFVLTQDDLLNTLEALELPEFSVYAVPITQLAEMAGLDFFAGTAPETAPSRSEDLSGFKVKEKRIRKVASVQKILG